MLLHRIDIFLVRGGAARAGLRFLTGTLTHARTRETTRTLAYSRTKGLFSNGDSEGWGTEHPRGRGVDLDPQVRPNGFKFTQHWSTGITESGNTAFISNQPKE
ncbi:hypothetical protein ACFV30_39875 [Streptomyces sp. NPDC059752]|uniref:hypothetical protein n=1 Tax=unclassified Streptomyces TaxID=2593676 RepID=UPI00364B21BB